MLGTCWTSELYNEPSFRFSVLFFIIIAVLLLCMCVCLHELMYTVRVQYSVRPEEGVGIPQSWSCRRL